MQQPFRMVLLAWTPRLLLACWCTKNTLFAHCGSAVVTFCPFTRTMISRMRRTHSHTHSKQRCHSEPNVVYREPFLWSPVEATHCRSVNRFKCGALCTVWNSDYPIRFHRQRISFSGTHVTGTPRHGCK